MLKETGPDGGEIGSLLPFGIAAVLMLPFASSQPLRPQAAWEVWQDRLLALGEHGELDVIAGIVQRARYEALGLVIDLLSGVEERGSVADYTLRKHWFRAARAKILTSRAGRLAPPNFGVAGTGVDPDPHEEDLRERAKAVLYAGFHAEFANTPLPVSVASSLAALETAGVGLFDAFALFLAQEIRDNARFRLAVLVAPEPDQTLFGGDLQTYLQKLFGIATTIAQRFDARLKLSEEDDRAAVQSFQTPVDLQGYWTGIAEAVADVRGLSRQTLAAIAERAYSKSLAPDKAGAILAEAAELLEQVRTELAEHLDLEDASLVSQALDQEGPDRALEFLSNISRSGPAAQGTTETRALFRAASVARLQGRLLELSFDFRRALGQHVQAMEIVAAGGAEARAQHASALVDALIRFGRTLGEREPLERAVAMCQRLVEAGVRKGSRLWMDIQLYHADALTELVRQQYAVARLMKADGIYAELIAGLAADEDKSVASVLHLRQAEALLLLGSRSNNAAVLERAVASCQRSAGGADRVWSARHYARAHGTLGDALVATAKGAQRQARMDQAIAAYEKACIPVVQKIAPYEWADLGVKLGSALAARARESGDSKAMLTALTTLEGALQDLPAHLFGQLRAEALLEIAQVHAALATGATWQGPLQLACEAYAAGLADDRLRAEKSMHWAQCKLKWCSATLRLANEDSNADLMTAAIEGFLECSTIPEMQSFHWFPSAAEQGAGDGLLARGRLTRNLTDLNAAEAAYRRAAALRPPDRVPVAWGQSLIGLASVLCETVRQTGARMEALRELTGELERALEHEAIQNALPTMNSVITSLNEAREVLSAAGGR